MLGENHLGTGEENTETFGLGALTSDLGYSPEAARSFRSVSGNA